MRRSATPTSWGHEVRPLRDDEWRPVKCTTQPRSGCMGAPFYKTRYLRVGQSPGRVAKEMPIETFGCAEHGESFARNNGIPITEAPPPSPPMVPTTPAGAAT